MAQRNWSIDYCHYFQVSPRTPCISLSLSFCGRSWIISYRIFAYCSISRLYCGSISSAITCAGSNDFVSTIWNWWCCQRKFRTANSNLDNIDTNRKRSDDTKTKAKKCWCRTNGKKQQPPISMSNAMTQWTDVCCDLSIKCAQQKRITSINSLTPMHKTMTRILSAFSFFPLSICKRHRWTKTKMMMVLSMLVMVSEMLSASNIEFYLFRHGFRNEKPSLNIEMKLEWHSISTTNDRNVSHSMKRNWAIRWRMRTFDGHTNANS